ncbi:hypothetical protein T12_3094 [Trichinella patagoniensis]|uniref:Uncharacterized protein n=1 Tax=Trichinella patagoniensis TaxID=990121 RepID=A0A0V0Z824_9BILA|nr:hypothetical protein T12_3094 [Trichinella patagoniensis]
MLERLFVKRKIVESLGLSGSKEHVTTVCAFNQSCNHRQLMGVELSLKEIMIDDEPYVINALCVSHICEKEPANPVLEEYEHLKGLRLSGRAKTNSNEDEIRMGYLRKEQLSESNAYLALSSERRLQVIKKFWEVEQWGSKYEIIRSEHTCMEKGCIEEKKEMDGIPGKTWYLPHHAVYRDDGTSTRCRLYRNPDGHLQDVPPNPAGH